MISVLNFQIWNKIKEESTVEASGEDEETHDNDSDQSDESRTHTVQGVKVFKNEKESLKIGNELFFLNLNVFYSDCRVGQMRLFDKI